MALSGVAIIALSAYLTFNGSLWGQTAEFEAASLKPASDTERGNCRGGPGSASPGQFTCVGWPLRFLVIRAWGLALHEYAGPPSAEDTRFSITAKVPLHTTKQEFNLMLRHLLESRLHLTVRRELQQQTVFDMVVAKGGLKMHPAEAAPATPTEASGGENPAPRLIRDANGNQVLPPGIPAVVTGGLAGGALQVMARMQDMDQVSRFVQSGVGRKVIDKTGLSGKFDFVMEYLPDKAASSRAAPDEGASAPTFAEAATSQLGLKLQAHKGMVEVLVVESFSKTPVAN